MVHPSRQMTRSPRPKGTNTAGPESCSSERLRSGSCACCKGGGLELAPIVLPPSLITRREVGPAAISSDDAVDQLAQDVGVTGVAIDVDDHVNQRPMKRE